MCSHTIKNPNYKTTCAHDNQYYNDVIKYDEVW